MNIWLLYHYASAPGKGRGERPLCVARELLKHGHSPVIIGAANHHLQFQPVPATAVGCLTREGQMQFYWVPARPYKRNGPGRFFNFLDYARGVRGLRHEVERHRLPRPDLVVASSPPPFMLPAAQRLARQRNMPFVFEERDLWPLSLVELAGVPRLHPLVLWMHVIVRRAYRHADAVVSLLPKALPHMEAMGLPADAWHYIPNGVSADDWNLPATDLPPEHQRVFSEYRRRSKFILLYAGAHGPPNALDQVLDLPALADQKGPYHFVFIGDGAAKQELERRARSHSLQGVSFLPPIPKSALRTALSQTDACFFSLRNSPLFRFGISPNKLFDYFMAAKPVVAALQAGNDPVTEAGAGFTVAPYDTQGLDRAIRRLLSLPLEARRELGRRGREYVRHRHDWNLLGKRYADLCERLVKNRRGAR